MAGVRSLVLLASCAIGTAAMAGALHHTDRAGRLLQVVDGDKLQRRFAQGQVDPSFGGPQGLPLASVLAGAPLAALDVDLHGRVLLAGLAAGKPLVRRLTPGGLPDPAWAFSSQLPGIEGHAPRNIAAVAAAPDGTVYVLGELGAGVAAGPLLWRLTAAGGLDVGFPVVRWTAGSAQALGLAVTMQGKVMIGVQTVRKGQSTQELHLLSLLPADAVPARVSAQSLPPGDFIRPVPQFGERRWLWVEGAHPDGEMARIQFLSVSAGGSPSWTRVPAQAASNVAAQPTAAAPVASTHEADGPGHAGFNPFAGGRSGGEVLPAAPSDADEGIGPVTWAAVGLLSMGLIAWSWRRRN